MDSVRVVVTPGEPAGIGPDLCIDIAARAWPGAIVVVCDPKLIRTRARQLGHTVEVVEVEPGRLPGQHTSGTLPVLSVPLKTPVEPGKPDSANASYVLDTLRTAGQLCLDRHCDAVVTGPVNKGVINDGGTAFTGHTEFFAELSNTETPVMMLLTDHMRIALATTHLPLSEVPAAITTAGLIKTLAVVDEELRRRFGIARPNIAVCGLNPHAGENGHLGREELDVIGPALESLRERGLQLCGPLPADTVFTPQRLEHYDAVLAMYHDQGLPVLKYSGFGQAVNLTLGLPILRLSVDHGTAFDLAATGNADSGSLAAALTMAFELAGR